MALVGIGILFVLAAVLIVGRLSEQGYIPYRYGAPFEYALEKLPAFLFFGGLIFSVTMYLLWDGSSTGTGCFIDWDGRSNPLSC